MLFLLGHITMKVKNINDETSKGATLNFYLITFTVLIISLVWVLTIIFSHHLLMINSELIVIY